MERSLFIEADLPFCPSWKDESYFVMDVFQQLQDCVGGEMESYSYWEYG
ncbi:MAG: hypothetical protein IKY43_02930 [Bacteroidales bacterium]|nr:hypothetical protein [Bacteroidales bacterium]